MNNKIFEFENQLVEKGYELDNIWDYELDFFQNLKSVKWNIQQFEKQMIVDKLS